MKPTHVLIAMLLVSLFFAPAVFAQSPDSANQSAASLAPSASAAEVPRLIKFSGTLLDAQDQPMAGPVGVTFALHAQQTGGAALWMETQNVTPDAHGNYTVLLGANSANGVPAELFASAEARWLEVQVERQAEQPRVLLVSVPYALKAKDAETLGGRPASAFVTTETLAAAGSSAGTATAASSSSTARPSAKAQTTPKKAASAVQPAVACTSVTSDGTATANSIAKFTAACAIQNSAITETGGNVGIGTTAPIRALDIEGGTNTSVLVRGPGTHNVQLTGSSSSGRLGQDLEGFFFSSDTNGKVLKFDTNNGTLNEWMRITSAGNVGIGTKTPGAKLEIAGGNLALPNTTSGGTAGVITLGGVPFLHNFGSGNTFVGQLAGNLSMPGLLNSAFGFSALSANTTGSQNSAFGSGVLFFNTMGNDNDAFGNHSLNANTTGNNNDAFGAFALNTNTTGSNNDAFGFETLFSNTTGSANAAFGASALQQNTTGTQNAAFGTNALLANTTACCNSAFGYEALFADTTGNNNSAFGDDALLANTTGLSDAAFGSAALQNNTTGGANSAFGANALQSNTTACCNSAFGFNALTANTTGGLNAAFGDNALTANTTGVSNDAFGMQALQNNTTGGANAAFGTFALASNMTGFDNDAFGTSALTNNTTGGNNSAFGVNALQSNTTGSNNAAFGHDALLNNTVDGNSAFGFNALQLNTTGSQNTAFGTSALDNLVIGNNNIAIGNSAGINLTDGDSNNISIGSPGVGGESTVIRIGTTGVHTAAYMAGIFGTSVFSGDGVGVFVGSQGQLGINMSSRRFKDDIADMAGESDLLMKLRPVSFYYKPELDPTHTRQYGLVAEEVAQVSPQLVVFDKDGVPQTVRYHFVNAMLLNEVQKQRQLIEEEQKANEERQREIEKQRQLVENQRRANEEQQSTIARQQAEIQDLAARLAKLEALVAPAP
ncbi:MAG: tail fiber domain-containing protein [Candidatus Acidiferrales bacterium]